MVMKELESSTFSIPDYLVFAAMLGISSIIGIYFACSGKQTSTKEYLMAGRDMGWFPLFVSLLASYLSAVTLLGVPSEIFTYGIQYIVLCFSYFILILTGVFIFLPIFYRMQVVSSNEYLEKRFSPGVRALGCLLVMTQYILYLAVVLYAPSLALESVAKVPLTVTIISTGLVCTFYTTLGGMKAVIWTDVFQAGVMVTGLIVVIIIGLVEIGGFSKLFEIARRGERMKVFDFNPDPTVRNSFWTLAIGGAFTAMPVWTVCQPAVQRFQAAKSLKEAKKALAMNIPGLIFIVLLCVLAGLVIYGVFHDCNIGTSGIKAVTSNDQVLPYFIINRLGHLKGIPGLFTSCLFSGALSTASSGLNSLAAVALEDIAKKIKPDITDVQSTWFSKIFACTLGLIIIGLAFLVSAFGTMVLQLAYSIFGIIGGPYLGLFFLGMMVPWSNSKGAYGGAIVGVSTTLWLAVGGMKHPPNKHPAVVNVTGCSMFNNTNATLAVLKGSGVIWPAKLYTPVPGISDSMASWYSMSYLWYAAIGIWFTFVAGCIFSLIYRWICPQEFEDEFIDPILLFDYREFFDMITPGCLKRNMYEVDKDKEHELDDIKINPHPSQAKLCDA